MKYNNYEFKPNQHFINEGQLKKESGHLSMVVQVINPYTKPFANHKYH